MFDRHVRLCLLVSLSACAATPPRTATIPAASLTTFERELDDIRVRLRPPGMTAAVVSGDSVIWRASLGFADVANGTRMNDTIAFPVASLTKTMTAVVIMQLAAEGRIGLDSLIPVLSHTSEGRVGEEYLYSGARLIVEIAVAMRVLLKMTIDAMHSLFQVNVLKVNSLVELLRIVCRHHFIVGIQQVALAIALEDFPKQPAVSVVISKLYVL